MATAIKITFTTPSTARPAKVKAIAYPGKMVVLSYDSSISHQENAEAALHAFLCENHWGEYTLGSLGNGDFVAVQLPPKYGKARNAVLLARRAISQGENNGNAHAKEWGQAITDLTDGIQPDGFASEYANLVMNGGL